MKKTILRIGSCIVAFLITVIGLSVLTSMMERKASDQKYADFFAEEGEFDVLFLGNSHMLNAVFPMEIWRDYGIVSYNLASETSTIETSYWILKNALDYQTPKVVVIDCHGSMFGDSKTSTAGISFLHSAFDAFPMSIHKYMAIKDLLDDPVMELLIENGEAEDSTERNLLSFLWDFSVYHTRWDSVDRSFFSYENSKEKGALMLKALSSPRNDMVPYSINLGAYEGNNLGAYYLKKMIRELQSLNIEVLLTYIPFPAVESFIKEANTVQNIADEYNTQFVNFLDLNVVNFDTDCADATAHLNASGGKKVSFYLGGCLMIYMGKC